MDKQYLNDEFNRFFEFPTEDKSHVSSVSAKLFVEHIAYPLEREIEQLRQRVAELEKERECLTKDWFLLKADADSLTAKRERLIAERDELSNIVESIGDLHHVTLDEWAVMKAERDALKQQRDGLLAALERSLESFEYIAKYGNSCGHSQLRIPDLKAAIASVKEK